MLGWAGGFSCPGAFLALALLSPVYADDTSAKTPTAALVGADNAVTPDRPGFTNGSDVVPKGRVQVEGGMTRNVYAASSGQGHETDAPEILLRTGLNDKTELRVTLPDYFWPSGSARSGFGDGVVGVRYRFYQSKDGNTKLAFTRTFSVPLKTAVTTSGHVDPTFLLSGQITSGTRWGLSSNLIFSYPNAGGSRLANYTTTPFPAACRCRAYPQSRPERPA